MAQHLVLSREPISGTATGTDPAAIFRPNGTGVQFHTPSENASSFGMPACLLQHGDVGLVARHGALRKTSYLLLFLRRHHVVSSGRANDPTLASVCLRPD